MKKKILAIVLIVLLFTALAGPAFAGKGGCPPGAAGDPGRGADGMPGVDMPAQAQRNGHGPSDNGPRGDNSAHGSWDGSDEYPAEKNFLRCN
jgi:hypothetical protein